MINWWFGKENASVWSDSILRGSTAPFKHNPFEPISFAVSLPAMRFGLTP